MSKVDTLLSLIQYQKQHKNATKKEIATQCGITPQYVSRCMGEANLLRQHLCEPPLEPDQMRLVMSLLDRHDPHHQAIAKKLHQFLTPSPFGGVLRMARQTEKPPYGYLRIGEVMEGFWRKEDPFPEVLDFWLKHLLYDPLFLYSRDGKISWRLATGLEPIKGCLSWHLTLRTDRLWSDGKPITGADVKETLLKSQLAERIASVKTFGTAQLQIQLHQESPLLPLRLTSTLIFPSHSKTPFSVTSSSYRLKRFRRETQTFRLEHHQEKDLPPDGGIDWLQIKRFSHPANAIKAVIKKEMDLLPLGSLQLLYQVEDHLPVQQFPFLGESYYMLFLNRSHPPLLEEKNRRRLKEAIDYRAINRYLHAALLTDERTIQSPLHCSLDMRITCPKADEAASYLAYLVGKSVGASRINPVSLSRESPDKMREEVDALLTRIFFGFGFSRLSRYFHSKGPNNPFAIANPWVDSRLETLDITVDLAQRQVIGQEVLSMLQDDFAVILLSPSFEYLLSPLEIQFDNNLTNRFDFAHNLSRLVVERQTGA